MVAHCVDIWIYLHCVDIWIYLHCLNIYTDTQLLSRAAEAQSTVQLSTSAGKQTHAHATLSPAVLDTRYLISTACECKYINNNRLSFPSPDHSNRYIISTSNPRPPAVQWCGEGLCNVWLLVLVLEPRLYFHLWCPATGARPLVPGQWCWSRHIVSLVTPLSHVSVSIVSTVSTKAFTQASLLTRR